MDRNMLLLIDSLQNGNSHTFLTKKEMNTIKKVFGSENVQMLISDLTYISIKPNTVPIFD